MKHLLSRLAMISSLVLAATLATQPSLAQEGGAVTAPLPRSMAAPVRLIPVAGASSFVNDNRVNLDNFDEGFSAGLLADFGTGPWSFETGVLTLGSQVNRVGDTASVNVDTWGIPLLAKLNFSGKPHETVFLKLGAMPFTTTGDIEETNLMGVGGIGAHIPLGRNSSILLDASYNRLFSTAGDLTNYQGISLLAGLSLNI